MTSQQQTGAESNADAGQPGQKLNTAWEQAVAGDRACQDQWQAKAGGAWRWQQDGLHVQGTGPEWSELHWQRCTSATLRELNNFVVEVTVRGKAEAAGLSFGDFKDFLAAVDERTGTRHLQLEVDLAAGRWAFRVDGQLAARCWWDAAVHSTDDLLDGLLALKARRVEDLHYSDLKVHTFQSSCQLSVIATCYRFQQRLRVTLRNWCHQDLPAGAYEILVVNPNSPDGTHEFLAAMAASYPHVRVREVMVDARLSMNKGALINRGIDASRGDWIWLTDADCLFAPNAASHVLAQVAGRRQHLFYAERRFLSQGQTAMLLSGRMDGVADFAALAQCTGPRAADHAPWGYTQIVHRSTALRVRYRENTNHYAHTDGAFVEECRRCGVTPQPVQGLFCLHLDHPFAWYGAQAFL